MQSDDVQKFVLLAVKHEAGYWTPSTIASELYLNDLLDSHEESSLIAFRDGILHRLVGRKAERFWANDAITPSRAAAIRSACQALHQLTFDSFCELTAEMAAGSSKPASPASPEQ